MSAACPAAHAQAADRLGLIRFVAPGVAAAGGAVLDVVAPPLAGQVLELPVAGDGSPCRDGRHGVVHYRCDDSLLFAVCCLDEDPAALPTPLQQATQAAYAALFDCLAANGYPHVLRVWNYLPQINLESHGSERYRQFNAGRQAAFAAAGRALSGAVPAACALGVGSGGLRIGLLAGRQPAQAVENPRQVSAYDYPPQYGAKSPTFARAGRFSVAGEPRLYVSGTAAIVGHRSLHIDDVIAQTRESIANLAAVVAAAGAPFTLAQLAYLVYLRDPADLPWVREQCRQQLGAQARLGFVQADVCRSELLVEIEACSLPAGVETWP